MRPVGHDWNCASGLSRQLDLGSGDRSYAFFPDPPVTRLGLHSFNSKAPVDVANARSGRAAFAPIFLIHYEESDNEVYLGTRARSANRRCALFYLEGWR
jgi:hypothetical protein